mgnify:CR=1 FL=1
MSKTHIQNAETSTLASEIISDLEKERNLKSKTRISEKQ